MLSNISNLGFMALLATPAVHAFKYYISAAADCWTTQLIIVTNDDDSCDAINNSADNDGGPLKRGGAREWPAQDGHPAFTIVINNDENYDSTNVGGQVGNVKWDDGKTYPMTVSFRASC
ncbi:hypothetical protein N7519_009967 [Penicillium mononematosum]|uniref:uncharacterized protein n=1 Tax=Penicillium mononematosum TaxID=268346 RepID=UPI0025488EE9|nr:uncharacterized protein N7519_009967 [Penicillium mononematosum]KAJ6179506.1 hypothetical protein N7519_009967 [Penicillium mononematosum]